jgi:uncharacterized protein (DUF885 family)
MRFGKFLAGLATAILSALVLSACGQAPQRSPPKPVSSAAWTATAAQFIEAWFKARPFFAAQSGRHEFDGQMQDFSAAGIAGEVARLHTVRVQLATVDVASLAPRQQFQREYLLQVVDNDLFWIEKAEFPFKNPAWYLDKIDPDMYLSRDYAPIDVRMKAYTSYLKSIPTVAANIRANLRTPLPKVFVDYAIDHFGGFADFYVKDAPLVFKDVKDAELQKQLAELAAAASKAMAELKVWFVSQRPAATDGFALGRDVYAAMLKDTERVEVPIADIEAAGRADLERNTAALKGACGVFAPKQGLAACVAKADSNKTPGGAVAGARAQLDALKDFIQKHNVAGIPSNEDAKVAEAPPYNRGNGAFIQIPGPYDSGVASIYNIAPPDPRWSAKEQADYVPGKGALLFTSVHEVWPGHFLQFLHSNGNPSKAEAIWTSYAFQEGWAHYSEEMMYDMGLGDDDSELHIGQLGQALLRDVRLLASIGLHTQGMTLAESEKLFREQAFQDAATARQQAARGAYDPAYLVYTMGKLMIRKLRSDWLAKRGYTVGDTRKHWREFHDELLSYGGPPIPLVRKEMLELILKAGSQRRDLPRAQPAIEIARGYARGIVGADQSRKGLANLAEAAA